MPCYSPPAAPTNLTLLFVDQTSAILAWSTPSPIKNESYLGEPTKTQKYHSDIVYKIRCNMCSSNVMYNPATDTFNETKITITNLEPVTTYTVQIHATNSVTLVTEPLSHSNETSNISNDFIFNNISTTQNIPPLDLNETKTQYAEIVFTTESVLLSTVFNLRILTISSKDADLEWDKPVQTDNPPLEFYEVRWFPKLELDSINKTALNTKDTKAHIEGLVENTEYGFQVRCKTLNGFGAYSNMIYAQTLQAVSSGNSLLLLHIINVFCYYYIY